MINPLSASKYASSLRNRRQPRKSVRAAWLLAGLIAFAIGIYLGTSMVDLFRVDPDVTPSSHRGTLSHFA
jgi:hypothetical protein